MKITVVVVGSICLFFVVRDNQQQIEKDEENVIFLIFVYTITGNSTR